MFFPTQYTKVHEIPTETGSRFVKKYGLTISPEGVQDLEETGIIDAYADIQSHHQSTDIHFILDRFQQTGDVTPFLQNKGTYGDFVNAPTTYAEMYQRLVQADELFAQLKPEVRAKFNNSVSEFFSQIGTEKFMTAVADFMPSAEIVKESVVLDSVKECE